MFTLIRTLSVSNLLITQAPALMLSFLIAELFYKFKSFSLECLAFLVTWFVIDALITGLRKLWRIPRGMENARGT